MKKEIINYYKNFNYYIIILQKQFYKSSLDIYDIYT